MVQLRKGLESVIQVADETAGEEALIPAERLSLVTTFFLDLLTTGKTPTKLVREQ